MYAWMDRDKLQVHSSTYVFFHWPTVGVSHHQHTSRRTFSIDCTAMYVSKYIRLCPTTRVNGHRLKPICDGNIEGNVSIVDTTPGQAENVPIHAYM